MIRHVVLALSAIGIGVSLLAQVAPDFVSQWGNAGAVGAVIALLAYEICVARPAERKSRDMLMGRMLDMVARESK